MEIASSGRGCGVRCPRLAGMGFSVASDSRKQVLKKSPKTYKPEACRTSLALAALNAASGGATILAFNGLSLGGGGVSRFS